MIMMSGHEDMDTHGNVESLNDGRSTATVRTLADTSFNSSSSSPNAKKPRELIFKKNNLEEAINVIVQLWNRLETLEIDSENQHEIFKKQESEISQLKTENAELKKKIAAKVAEPNNLSTGMPSWVDIVKGEKPTEMVTKILAIKTTEESAIESKQKNVIIVGVEEVKNSQGEIDVEADKRVVESILREIGTQGIAPSYVKRLKSKRENHPGPILVELPYKEDRKLVLTASRALRSSSTFKNVYINPDLTPAQKRLDSELRKERDVLNSPVKLDDPFRWGIRRNRVVRVKNIQH